MDVRYIVDIRWSAITLIPLKNRQPLCQHDIQITSYEKSNYYIWHVSRPCPTIAHKMIRQTGASIF